jgi:hypothetical protein
MKGRVATYLGSYALAAAILTAGLTASAQELDQGLHLTITSRNIGQSQDPVRVKQLSTVREIYVALKSCWVPPLRNQAHSGFQIAVRLSLTRIGSLIGPPFVTYMTRDAGPETQDIYRHSVTQSIERCTPLYLSSELGGAVAGRLFTIRYVENRNL